MWKDDKKSAGYREVNAWLSPEALAALDAVKPAVGKVAVGDLIGAALIHAAGSGWRYGADADLAARLDKIEAGTVAPKTAQKSPEAAKQGKGSDLVAIAKAVAERRVRDGDDFKRAALWRELKAAGVKVHATPENFSTAVAKILARGQA